MHHGGHYREQILQEDTGFLRQKPLLQESGKLEGKERLGSPNGKAYRKPYDSWSILPRARLAYIDWLRFTVVLCLAPFHAASSFAGMGSVPVYDTPVLDLAYHRLEVVQRASRALQPPGRSDHDVENTRA